MTKPFCAFVLKLWDYSWLLQWIFWRMLMWEDGFCRGRVSECLEEIDGDDPVRKAFSKMSIQLYNYGEGWVLGRCLFVCFDVVDSPFCLFVFSLSFLFTLSIGFFFRLFVLMFFVFLIGLIRTGWWGKLHQISAINGFSKNLQNASQTFQITGKVHLMLYANNKEKREKTNLLLIHFDNPSSLFLSFCRWFWFFIHHSYQYFNGFFFVFLWLLTCSFLLSGLISLIQEFRWASNQS